MKWFYIIGTIIVLVVAGAAYLVFGDDSGDHSAPQAAPSAPQQPGSSSDDNLFKNLK